MGHLKKRVRKIGGDEKTRKETGEGKIE